MYNEEQKRMFLEQLAIEGYSDNHIKTYKTIFRMSAPYEEKNGYDICFFSKDDIREMYESSKYSYMTRQTYNSKLNIYVNKIGEKNKAFSELKKELQNEEKEEKFRIISYKDMKEVVRSLPNYADKFLVYGLFCGICGKNYVELTCSSIEECDPTSGMIWLAGVQGESSDQLILKARKFYAERELFQIAIESANVKEYVISTKNDLNKKHSLDEKSSRIMKMARGEGEMIPHRSSVLRRFVKLTEHEYLKDMMPIDLYWSGIVYNIRKLEVEIGDDQKVKSAKEAIKLPGFEKIKEQYNITLEDRSLIAKLERYL